jgi:hypothetical protein
MHFVLLRRKQVFTRVALVQGELHEEHEGSRATLSAHKVVIE